jgi:hypothetical protein
MDMRKLQGLDIPTVGDIVTLHPSGRPLLMDNAETYDQLMWKVSAVGFNLKVVSMDLGCHHCEAILNWSSIDLLERQPEGSPNGQYLIAYSCE